MARGNGQLIHQVFSQVLGKGRHGRKRSVPKFAGPVLATLTSDDGMRKAVFDAQAWLETASETEIIELADCGWGGDYPGDSIAYHFEKKSPEVGDFFAYLYSQGKGKTSPIGFECYLEAVSAQEWLRWWRPGIYQKLKH